MPSVIIDAEEVRAFARYLDRTADSIQGRRQEMGSAFARLSEMWFDQRFHQFDAAFHDMLTHLDQFHRMAESVANHLNHKAARIDDYFSGGGYR